MRRARARARAARGRQTARGGAGWRSAAGSGEGGAPPECNANGAASSAVMEWGVRSVSVPVSNAALAAGEGGAAAGSSATGGGGHAAAQPRVCAAHPAQPLCAAARGATVAEFDAATGCRLSAAPLQAPVVKLAYSPTHHHALICVLADYTLHRYTPLTGAVSPLYRPDKPSKDPLTECHLALPRCVPWVYFCAAGRSSVYVVPANATGALATRVSRAKPVTAMVAHPRDPVLFVAYSDGTLAAFDMDLPPTPPSAGKGRSKPKVESRPRWTAGEEGGGKRGPAARVIHSLCFHPRAGGRLLYAGDSMGAVTALAVVGGTPPRLLERTKCSRVAVRALSYAIPGGSDGVLLVLSAAGSVTGWEAAAQAGGLCRAPLPAVDGGHILALDADGPPRQLSALMESSEGATTARANISAIAATGGCGTVIALVSNLKPLQKQLPTTAIRTRRELLMIRRSAKELCAAGGLARESAEAQAARTVLEGALRAAGVRAPTAATLGRTPTIEDLVDAALYAGSCREGESGARTDQTAFVEPRVAILSLGVSSSGMQPFTAGIFTRSTTPVWYLIGGSAAQQARSPLDHSVPAFAFPNAYYFLEAGRRLGKYSLVDHLVGIKFTLPQDSNGAKRGAPAPKAVAIEESPAGDAWLVKYRRPAGGAGAGAQGTSMAVTALVRNTTPPNRIALRDCVDAAYLQEGRLALLVETADAGGMELHCFAPEDSRENATFLSAVPMSAVMLRAPATHVFRGHRASSLLLAGAGELRLVLAPPTDAVDEPGEGEQARLALLPAERVIDVTWQHMALSARQHDASSTPTVGAVLTTRRLLIVAADDLQVLAHATTPACADSPVGSPFPFHSCLWAGPCLLYSAAGGEVGALLWDSSVRKVASVDVGAGGAGAVALLACLQDRLIIGGINPVSGRAEISRRTVALMEPLTLALVTYARSEDPKTGARRMTDPELRSLLVSLVGSLDGSIAPRPALRALCSMDLPDLAAAMVTSAHGAMAGDRFEVYLASHSFYEARSMLRDEYEHSSTYPLVPYGSQLAVRFARLARVMIAAGQAGAAAEMLSMAGDALGTAALAALKRDTGAAQSAEELCKGAPRPVDVDLSEDAELDEEEHNVEEDNRGRVLLSRAAPSSGTAELARALVAAARDQLGSHNQENGAGAPAEGFGAFGAFGAEDASSPVAMCSDFALVRPGDDESDFAIEQGLSATIKCVSEDAESGYELVSKMTNGRLDQYVADKANVDGSGAAGTAAAQTAQAIGSTAAASIEGSSGGDQLREAQRKSAPHAEGPSGDSDGEGDSTARGAANVSALKRALSGAPNAGDDDDGDGSSAAKFTIRIRDADDVVTPTVDRDALKALTTMDLTDTSGIARKKGFRFRSRGDYSSSDDSSDDDDVDSNCDSDSDGGGSLGGGGGAQHQVDSETPIARLRATSAASMPVSVPPTAGAAALIEQAANMRKQATALMEANNLGEARQWLSTALGDLAQEDLSGHSQARKEASLCVRYTVACGLLAAIDRAASAQEKARLSRQMASLPLLPRHRLLALRASAQRDAALGNWGLAKRAIGRMPAGAPGVAKMRAVAARHNDENADPRAEATNPSLFCCATFEPLERAFTACTRCGARFNPCGGNESGDPCALCLAGVLRSAGARR